MIRFSIPRPRGPKPRGRTAPLRPGSPRHQNQSDRKYGKALANWFPPCDARWSSRIKIDDNSRRASPELSAWGDLERGVSRGRKRPAPRRVALTNQSPPSRRWQRSRPGPHVLHACMYEPSKLSRVSRSRDRDLPGARHTGSAYVRREGPPRSRSDAAETRGRSANLCFQYRSPAPPAARSRKPRDSNPSVFPEEPGPFLKSAWTDWRSRLRCNAAAEKGIPCSSPAKVWIMAPHLGAHFESGSTPTTVARH